MKRLSQNEKPRCGICGSSIKQLTRTECCGNWICDDETSYRLFSYARNSCSRNHRRFTLCAYHHVEEHTGDWKTCARCRRDFRRELEMYVWYGTNEYNFEKLADPPAYEPTHCSDCGVIIRLPYEEYSAYRGAYYCAKCSKNNEDLRSKNDKGGAIRRYSRRKLEQEKIKISQRRTTLESEISEFLSAAGNSVTLDDVKKIVLKEHDNGAIMDVIDALRDPTANDSEKAFDCALTLANDAWNYFPHESLGGLAPVEKILEYYS